MDEGRERKVEMPSVPIKLCLKATKEYKPCRWLVKKKMYVCHSGRALCPLMRNPRYYRLHAVYILKRDRLRREINVLQKEKAYFAWAAQGYGMRAGRIEKAFPRKLERAIVDEKRLRQVLKENERKHLKATHEKHESERQIALGKFYREQIIGLDEKKSIKIKHIEKRQKQLKKKYEGFDRLNRDWGRPSK